MFCPLTQYLQPEILQQNDLLKFLPIKVKITRIICSCVISHFVENTCTGIFIKMFFEGNVFSINNNVK